MALYKKIYFVSKDNMDGKVLTPRVPKNFLTDNGYEDATTKRVCFSSSINGCLIALSQNLEGKEFYVHTPVDMNSLKIVKPSKSQVPDISHTKELWVTNPVKIKAFCKIIVGKAKDKPLMYKYGDNKIAYLYAWEYTRKELTD